MMDAKTLGKSIINFLLRRVIVRTTTIKYAQFDARPKFYVVVTVVCVCAYASDSVGWVCSQKRERTKSASVGSKKSDLGKVKRR